MTIKGRKIAKGNFAWCHPISSQSPETSSQGLVVCRIFKKDKEETGGEKWGHQWVGRGGAIEKGIAGYSGVKIAREAFN